jgi:glycine oxidase
MNLSRPVRLLHPRQPIYVVPQGDGRYVVGATVIEREDDGPMTVRSALELLGSAYALHPAFSEAAILDMGAGVRPAFADNVPRVIIEDTQTIRVNGAYRHGFLLSPVMAGAVVDFLATGRRDHPLITA